jgi:hypothetical protein
LCRLRTRASRARNECDASPVEETGAGAGGLRFGQHVKVRVRGHQSCWLSVEIVGHEGIGASIDYLDIAGPRRRWPRPDDFPVGPEIEAVIRNRLPGPEPPRWYYLTVP